MIEVPKEVMDDIQQLFDSTDDRTDRTIIDFGPDDGGPQGHVLHLTDMPYDDSKDVVDDKGMLRGGESIKTRYVYCLVRVEKIRDKWWFGENLQVEGSEEIIETEEVD